MTRSLIHRASLAILAVTAVSCGQLLGLEPWDPNVDGAGGDATSATSTSSGAAPGPAQTSGTSSGTNGDGGGTASTATTSSDTPASSGGHGAGGDGGSGTPTTSSGADGGGGAASSTAAGPCGGLDECMGQCLDCFGGGCVTDEPRCEPGFLGHAESIGAEAYLAIGPDQIWYARGTKFFKLPLRGPGGDAPVAANVAQNASGIVALADDAIGAHAGGIVRIPASGEAVQLFAAPSATVSGVDVGDGQVWFGGAWSGFSGIYAIDDTIPTAGALAAICTNAEGAPGAVVYFEHDLYLGAVNGPSFGGGVYHCASEDGPGAPMVGDSVDKSVRRISRTSFGDFAAAAFHGAAPELLRFDDDATLVASILEQANVYDVAAWEGWIFFTLGTQLGGLTTDGVYAIPRLGNDVTDIVRVATCAGSCQAVATDGEQRLVYSQADGGVWSLQLENRFP